MVVSPTDNMNPPKRLRTTEHEEEEEEEEEKPSEEQQGEEGRRGVDVVGDRLILPHTDYRDIRQIVINLGIYRSTSELLTLGVYQIA